MVFAWGSKSQEPYLGLNLAGFGCRDIFWRRGASWSDGAVAAWADWVAVYGEDVRVAIVEAILMDEVESHVEETVVAAESDATGDCRVAATFLAPVIEDIAGGQHSRRGDDCFNHVRAIEAGLVVDCAIR